MYHRLSSSEIQDLSARYANDRLFQNLYSAIAAPCAEYGDITPEEIWQLASEYVRTITQTDNDLFEIDALPSKLHFLLSTYQVGDSIIQRKPEDIQRTVFFVELVILYQLMRCQKQLENHPYQRYCLATLSNIQDNPLMAKIIPVIKETNDRYELIYGDELDTHDYLERKPVIPQQQQTAPSLSDESHRRTLLSKIYAALIKQLGDTFTGKSQWFYVYRLMADCKIYENNSYSLFVSDLRAAGVANQHLPNTSTFSRKQQQLKSNSPYPNWQVKSNGKQNILDEGKRIAQIAFNILFP